MFRVCLYYTDMSVPCGLVITFWYQESIQGRYTSNENETKTQGTSHTREPRCQANKRSTALERSVKH